MPTSPTAKQIGPSRRSDSVNLPLPEILSPGELERQLITLYKRERREPDDLVLDFGSCTYIEIAELCHAIAIFRARLERNKKTRLRLPRSKTTGDFMKVWQFLDALSDSMRRPKEELLVPEDVVRMNEPITTYEAPSASLEALETRWGKDANRPQVRKNFFGFMTYPMAGPKQLDLFPGENALIPLNEASRWQEPLIKAVLNNHLRARSGEEEEFARVVVYESLANAVQHPKASTIHVVSRLYPATAARPELKSIPHEGAFTICVWDDGESMVQTLGRALKKVGKVRHTTFPIPMYDRLLMKLKDETGKKICEDKIIDQADDLPLDASDEMIFLACLFPGVSRRVADPVGEIPKFSDSPTEASNLPNIFGMGLYILTRTVVDRYGGELSIRSGRYFLNLKLSYDVIRVPNRARYTASITRYPTSFPPFKGNLLYIRILGR